MIDRTAEALRSEYEGDFFQQELFFDATRQESIVTHYLPESMSLYEFEN
ncbi:MAG: hypothetical protein PUP90_01045 [Nostoc sp. S4]|nr:hypothetical protein [Nostoc sp. S4]